MVLGEPQILGQMKQAEKLARDAGSMGLLLNHLFQRTFAVAKEVRTTTEIGAQSVSMAAAAVRVAERIYGVAGSEACAVRRAPGEMIELAATHFAARHPKSITVANRTLERAHALAARLHGQSMKLADLPEQLARFDIVVSCTASSLPIIGLGLVERAIRARKHRPMFIVDLAVPRDVEPEVARLDDVYVYTVDDLGTIVRSGTESRKAAVAQAEAIIETRVRDFEAWWQARAAVPLIQGLRTRADALRSIELERARRLLARGDAPDAVLEQLSQALMNKFLHAPMSALQEASLQDEAERGAPRRTARALLQLARQLAARTRSLQLPARRGRSAPSAPPFDSTRHAFMKSSMQSKLAQLATRLGEIDRQLSAEDGARDMNRFRALSQERAEIDPVVTRFREHERTQSDLLSAQEMLSDPDMKLFAEEEIGAAKARLVDLEADLERLLLPKDPNDERNVFLEVRAGTGGDESALFAGDLLRMYLRFAERQRWQTEMISSSDSDLGGYKEAIVRIVGAGAYSKLKFESGGHRVQRVPETEAQGRIHTSACTVAVLPEADEIDDVKIDPSEIRIDVYRASGAGGQHVNKTESAVRITHLSDRHRGRVPGRPLAAQEQGTRAQDPRRAHQGQAGAGAAEEGGEHAQEPDRLGRSQRAHPHLQLPAGSRDRPPHQPDAVQDRPDHGRRHQRTGVGARCRIPGRAVGSARRSRVRRIK